jgi:hypothetical protein
LARFGIGLTFSISKYPVKRSSLSCYPSSWELVERVINSHLLWDGLLDRPVPE